MLSEMFLMFLRESKTSYIFMLQIFITPSDCDAVRLTFENIEKSLKMLLKSKWQTTDEETDLEFLSMSRFTL